MYFGPARRAWARNFGGLGVDWNFLCFTEDLARSPDVILHTWAGPQIFESGFLPARSGPVRKNDDQVKCQGRPPVADRCTLVKKLVSVITHCRFDAELIEL
jgi:hypothetical protein